MADIAQHVLHHDLFYALGAHLLFSLEGPTKFWQPAKQPTSSSQPETATITVTQAVPMSRPATITVTSGTTVFSPFTLTEKFYETALAMYSVPETVTTTSYVSHTVRDTVTEQVTWNSTITERHWLTSWTHYPTTDSTPEPTFKLISDPIPDLVPDLMPPNLTIASAVSLTALRGSWEWAVLTLFFLAIGIKIGLSLGCRFHKSKQANVENQQKAALKNEEKRYLATKDMLREVKAKSDTLLGGNRNEGDAHQELFIGALETLLGCSINTNEDPATFLQSVRNKHVEIVTKAEEHVQLTNANETLRKEKEVLEDSKKELLNRHYVPGVHVKYDIALEVMRDEIKRHRSQADKYCTDEASKARENQIVALEEQISTLLPYAEESKNLEKKLSEAQDNNNKLEAQFKERLATKSRKYDEEFRKLESFVNIREAHSKPICSNPPATSDGTSQSSEVRTDNDELKKQVDEAEEDSRQLRESLEACRAERDDIIGQFKNQKAELDDQSANDRKKYEDEIRALRGEITELRTKLAIFKQDQQSSPLDDTNEVRQSARIATLERELGDLSAQKLRSDEEDQTNECIAKELSVQLEDLNRSLEAKNNNEQNLLDQINSLNNERNTARIETLAITKQLEEATASNVAGSWVSQADVDGYIAKMTEKDEYISRLLAEGEREIGSRDQTITALESHAEAGNQAIDGLKQQVAELQSRAEIGTQTISNLKKRLGERNNIINSQKELLGAVDEKKLNAGRIDVAGKDTEIRQLKHEIGRLEEQAKKNARLRTEKIDTIKTEMQQTIDELKNSQEAENLVRLELELAEKTKTIAEFSENGPAGYMKLLQEKQDQIKAKEEKICRLKKDNYKLGYDLHKLRKSNPGNHNYNSPEWDIDDILLTGNESQLRMELNAAIVKVKQLEAEVNDLNTEKDKTELEINNLVLFGDLDLPS